MATVSDQTLPHDGAISMIDDAAPALAATWNDPFGEINDVLAHLGGALTVVVEATADLAAYRAPDSGAMLAIVSADRTIWANWNTAPAGDGTAVGAGGTRWVRLSPTRQRALFYATASAAIEPAAPGGEVVLATVQGRTGAYGSLAVHLSLSSWARTQDPDAQLRIHTAGDSQSSDLVVVDLTDTDTSGPLELSALHADYPDALVTVTVYATGVECPAGAVRLLTCRND